MRIAPPAKSSRNRKETNDIPVLAKVTDHPRWGGVGAGSGPLTFPSIVYDRKM
jgi:hypothetical protein